MSDQNEIIPAILLSSHRKEQNGLPTPESSVEPDEARNKANNQLTTSEKAENRGGASSADQGALVPKKGKEKANEPASENGGSASSADQGALVSRKGKEKVVEQPNEDSASSVDQVAENPGHTKEQEDEIMRILSADENRHYDILGLPNHIELSRPQAPKAYRRLALLVHPDKCKHKDANKAMLRLDGAKTALGLTDVEPETPKFVDSDGYRIDQKGNRIDEDGNRIGIKIDISGNRFDEQGNKIDEDGDRLNVDGNKIDADGNRIDKDGDRIDADGNKIDEEGNRIDRDGNRIDENGNILPEVTRFRDGDGNLVDGDGELVDNESDLDETGHRIRRTVESDGQSDSGSTAEVSSGSTAGPRPEPRPGPTTAVWPWATGTTADGRRIMGCMPRGRGHRVIVETEPGKKVFRIQSASESGMVELQKYLNTPNILILSGTRTKRTFKDRSKYVSLDYMAISNYNTHNPFSKTGARKDPESWCFATLQDEGLVGLTTSELRQVIGQTSADAAVNDICGKDNTKTPMEKKPENILVKGEDYALVQSMGLLPTNGKYPAQIESPINRGKREQSPLTTGDTGNPMQTPSPTNRAKREQSPSPSIAENPVQTTHGSDFMIQILEKLNSLQQGMEKLGKRADNSDESLEKLWQRADSADENQSKTTALLDHLYKTILGKEKA